MMPKKGRISLRPEAIPIQSDAFLTSGIGIPSATDLETIVATGILVAFGKAYNGLGAHRGHSSAKYLGEKGIHFYC